MAPQSGIWELVAARAIELICEGVPQQVAVEQAIEEATQSHATGSLSTNPILQQQFAQVLLKHFRSIQRHEGDQELREALSAAREDTNCDWQITDRDRAKCVEALDAIQEELLPTKM